jgi:hypothetical protein
MSRERRRAADVLGGARREHRGDQVLVRERGELIHPHLLQVDGLGVDEQCVPFAIETRRAERQQVAVRRQPVAVFDDEVADVAVSRIDQRAREGAERLVGRAHHRGAFELAGSGAEVVGLDIPQDSGIRPRGITAML